MAFARQLGLLLRELLLELSPYVGRGALGLGLCLLPLGLGFSAVQRPQQFKESGGGRFQSSYQASLLQGGAERAAVRPLGGGLLGKGGGAAALEKSVGGAFLGGPGLRLREASRALLARQCAQPV